MNKVYAALAAIWLGCVGAGEAMWMTECSSSIDSTAAEITAQSPPTEGGVTGAPSVEGHDSSTPRVDVLGNEIEDAIADYRVDLAGAVYERHSPETAVPRLGSPII